MWMKLCRCQGGQGRRSQCHVKPSAMKEFDAERRRSNTPSRHLPTHSTKMHTKAEQTQTRKAQTHLLLFSWIWLLVPHPLAEYPAASCPAGWSSGCCSRECSASPAERAPCSSGSSSLLWDACSCSRPLLKQHKPDLRDGVSSYLFLSTHMKWDLSCWSTPASTPQELLQPITQWNYISFFSWIMPVTMRLPMVRDLCPGSGNSCFVNG